MPTPNSLTMRVRLWSREIGASIEQGAGSAQVNQAIAQMDQVTQQNAALVEGVATAASSLQDLAQHWLLRWRCSRSRERRPPAEP